MKAILVFASGTTAEVDVPKGPTWLKVGSRHFVKLGDAYECSLDKGKPIFAERPETVLSTKVKIVEVKL